MAKPRIWLTKAQRIALGNYLSKIPEDKTYDEICDMIEDGDDSVSVWEPFEDYPGEEIVGFIASLRANIHEAFYG